ncbi:MAG: hydroxyethylthiazole kinase [Rikenellaceae bacterium]
MINREQLAADLAAIRTTAPLVHSITNYVAMNFNANVLLSMGASPVMAHAVEEMEAMTSIAGALVINIGTLDAQWVEGMFAAGRAMRTLGRPIVLDPVGSGATPYRTNICKELIEECRPTIIRGNGSEIMSLAMSGIVSKGVDSSESSSDAVEAAKALAQSTDAVVVVSGEIDYITDGKRVETIQNGSTMMTRVTAMGCSATAVVAAFAAVNLSPFEAALHAMALMGVAGERAAARSAAPGSLLTNFVDELYLLTPQELADSVRQ